MGNFGRVDTGWPRQSQGLFGLPHELYLKQSTVLVPFAVTDLHRLDEAAVYTSTLHMGCNQPASRILERRGKIGNFRNLMMFKHTLKHCSQYYSQQFVLSNLLVE